MIKSETRFFSSILFENFEENISGRMGTRNPSFGYPQNRGEMGLKQDEQNFSSFFANFCHI